MNGVGDKRKVVGCDGIRRVVVGREEVKTNKIGDFLAKKIFPKSSGKKFCDKLH